LNNRVSRKRKWNILVTPKEACELIHSIPDEYSSGIDFKLTFGRVQDPSRIAFLLRECDGVVLDIERITKSIISACPGLKVISRFGEGYDAIDLDAVKAHNVRLARTRGVASAAVARHTIALIMALMHNVTENDKSLKSGAWRRKPNISEETVTIGIFGFGKIGSEVARLAKCLGFKVLVCGRSVPEDAGFGTARDLDDLVSRCDLLSLHVPLSGDTKDLISKKMLKRLKGKFLVNTARGGIVDEKALLVSLKGNGIAGYATDVFAKEPVKGISRMIAKHPKVVCSAHLASFNRMTAEQMTERSVANAFNCLEGRDDLVAAYVV